MKEWVSGGGDLLFWMAWKLNGVNGSRAIRPVRHPVLGDRFFLVSLLGGDTFWVHYTTA
jgi:hypothetical protein